MPVTQSGTVLQVVLNLYGFLQFSPSDIEAKVYIYIKKRFSGTLVVFLLYMSEVTGFDCVFKLA